MPVSLKVSAKSVITLGVIAALLLIGVVVIYVVGSGSLRRVEAELNSRQGQVESSRRIADRLLMTEQRYEESKAQLAILESSVSAAEYIPTLLKQLENTGREVHLKVLAVRPRAAAVAQTNSAAQSDGSSGTPGRAAPAGPKPYETLNIDIEVEGAYWDTVSFLRRLTSFPKIVAVDSIQIAPTSVAGVIGVSPQLTVQLSVSAFVFRQESTAATIRSAPAGGRRAMNAQIARLKHETG